MSASIDLEFDRRDEGSVATITINNPAKLNVMNSRLNREFTERVQELESEDDLRAVVVTGAGERAFVGGADISEMATLDAGGARAFIEGVHETCAGIRSIPVPVIARIRGYCYGAGLEMAAACDMRVATEASVFGMPEVRVGVPSVVEAALLPRLIGWGKTQELLLTGSEMTAAEALRCGLIERLVPDETLDESVEDWVRAILASAPGAIRLQKELIREWERLPLADAVERGVQSFERAFHSDEPRRYMKRFLNRKR